jgi:hypothetical protein
MSNSGAGTITNNINQLPSFNTGLDTNSAWTNKTNAWDQNLTTYAYKSFPANTNDVTDTLVFTGTPTGCPLYNIKKVEVGIYHYESGTLCYPNFKIKIGSNTSSTYYTGTRQSSGSWQWFDITNDSLAPSWTGINVGTINVILWGTNSYVSSSRTLYIGEVTIRITFESLNYVASIPTTNPSPDPFNQSSINGMWTQSFTTGGSGSESSGGLNLISGTGSSIQYSTYSWTNPSGIYQTINSNSIFDVILKVNSFTGMNDSQTVVDFAEISFCHYINSSNYLLVSLYQDANIFKLTYYDNFNNGSYTGFENGYVNIGSSFSGPIYFRISNNGTTANLYYSLDNTTWNTLLTNVYLLFSTAGKLWVTCNDDNGGGIYTANFSWLQNTPAIQTPIQLYTSNVGMSHYLAITPDGSNVLYAKGDVVGSAGQSNIRFTPDGTNIYSVIK